MPEYSLKPWKFLLLTFGCKVNQYESEALREAWTSFGGVETLKACEANLICINSCAITAKGERDCRAAIARVRRENSYAKIILTGCAASLYDQEENNLTKPDLIVKQNLKEQLLNNPLEILAKIDQPIAEILPLALDSGTPNHNPPFSIKTYKRARAVLKIQDGCKHRCTYCIVPTLRPNLASRKPEEIFLEAKRLVENGFAEIILSGINLKQYGQDQKEFGDFWSVLINLEHELINYTDRVRIRLSSIEPSQLTPLGLEVLAQSHLICPQLHISLQHASLLILAKLSKKLANFGPNLA